MQRSSRRGWIGIYGGAAAGPDVRVAFSLGLGILAALLLGGLGSVILIVAHAITSVSRVRSLETSH